MLTKPLLDRKRNKGADTPDCLSPHPGSPAKLRPGPGLCLPLRGPGALCTPAPGSASSTHLRAVLGDCRACLLGTVWSECRGRGKWSRPVLACCPFYELCDLSKAPDLSDGSRPKARAVFPACLGKCLVLLSPRPGTELTRCSGPEGSINRPLLPVAGGTVAQGRGLGALSS